MSLSVPFFDRVSLFRAGEGPSAIYRIPGIVATPGGALMAYCEARRNPQGDWGAAEILLSGSAGYADVAVGADGTAFCFYEGGGLGDDVFACQYLWLARLNLEWLEGANP